MADERDSVITASFETLTVDFYGLWSPVRELWFYNGAGDLFYTPSLGVALAQLNCVLAIQEAAGKQIIAQYEARCAAIQAEAARQAMQHGKSIVIPNLRGDGKPGAAVAVDLPPMPKLPDDNWAVAVIGDDGSPLSPPELAQLEETEREHGK